MPSKRCAICKSVKNVAGNGVCCSRCVEKELDILMTVYAYIHCNDSEYCPPGEILDGLEVVEGVEITERFISSWISRDWLETNPFGAVRVPPAMRESVEENGFKPSAEVRAALRSREDAAARKIPFQRDIPEPVRALSGGNAAKRMVFMEKKAK